MPLAKSSVFPACPVFAASAAAAFAAVAFDVNSPFSLHLLEAPDMAIHLWVASHTCQGDAVASDDPMMNRPIIFRKCLLPISAPRSSLPCFSDSWCIVKLRHAEFRSTTADVFISDAVLAISVPGCVAAATLLLSQRPASGSQRLAVVRRDERCPFQKRRFTMP